MYYNSLTEECVEYGKRFVESTDHILKESLYNPDTKLFEVSIGNRNVRIQKDFFELKYMRDFCDDYFELKRYEWLYLYEGLVTSASADTVVSKLSTFEEYGLIYGVSQEGMMMFDANKTPFVSFFMLQDIFDMKETDPEISLKYKELLMLLNNLGYFIANIQNTKSTGRNSEKLDLIYFAVHPKYIIEVTDTIYNKFDGVIYHLTLEKNYEKIQKTGLIPKNSNDYIDNYPERIYFFPKCPPDKFDMYIKIFAKSKKEAIKKDLEKSLMLFKNGKLSLETLRYKYCHRHDYRKWTVLRINLKEKNSYIEDDITTHYRFFDDPKSQGIFTYENIDPRCIHLLRESELDIDKNMDDLIPKEIMDGTV